LQVNNLELEQQDWPEEPLSKEEINNFALLQLQRFDEFHWSSASDFMIYSAAVQTDSIMAVGFQIEGFENINERMHEVDMQANTWKNKRQEIIDFIVEATNRIDPTRTVTSEDLMPFGLDEYLPALDIKIANPDLVSALRKRKDIRYVEPMGYGSEPVGLRSDSGCDVQANNNINSNDFSYTSPDARVSWHLEEMNVDDAWNVSSGRGITIAVLDTGTDPNQSKLNGSFNQGESTGRTLTRRGYFRSGWWWNKKIDGPNDRCGHGTQMAGLAVAPKGFNKTIVGSAYGANLVALRVTSDVIVNTSDEKRGVADGLTYSANRSDVKVISMSIGDVFSSSRVADAVRYAHGRGKLIFAAAGTSLSWTSWWGVIFPANMSETVAVTGVKDGFPLQKCNTCHDGSQVDFVAVMQRRSNNDRLALTLAPSGNTPANVGGSSAATATTAGIAALVWATNPGMSRTTVLNRLKNASQFYPSRDGNFGWGRIDANAAVQGQSY
ncbi:MAG: S8 family serine peptidase, partial [Bacteroidota bacterium]